MAGGGHPASADDVHRSPERHGAFVVRLTLVPAVMWLLDWKAWYMPAWLDRILPPLTIEPPVSEAPGEQPPLRPVPAGASAGD